MQVDNQNLDIKGLPWEHTEWHDKNEEIVVKHVQNYQDVRLKNKCFSGKCKSFVQLESEQPYGIYEKERDQKSGYPDTDWIPKKWPSNNHG